MQKLKPSCWPEVRGGFSGRGWSPELHAAAQAVATFLGPRLPALQRLSLQSREPGVWNGLTPSAHVSLFPSGVCVRLGLLSQENPCGLLLAFPPLISVLSFLPVPPLPALLSPIKKDAVPKKWVFASNPSGCCFPVFIPSSGITILKDDSEAQELH